MSAAVLAASLGAAAAARLRLAGTCDRAAMLVNN